MVVVCFDLDGTLYDDRDYVLAGFQSAATYLRETHGVETFGDMVWDYGVKRNFDTVFDRIIATYGLPETELDNLIAEYHDCDPDLQPYPDAEAVLAELSDRYLTAAITGGKHGERKLEWLGLEEAFDTVYVTPEHKTSKREATPFEAVLDELGTSPERALFVGDNPELDFYWPNRLGMKTIWIRREETMFTPPESIEMRPDYVLPDLSLVPQIAERETKQSSH